jgi:hypothetical protein
MAEYGDSLPTAVRCFDDDFEACIAHLRLPVTHRRSTRTTNLIEHLFGEERRRLKIVPNAFGEKPVLKLMFGALIRAAESWRGLRFTEFELRQLDALRKDLDATVNWNFLDEAKLFWIKRISDWIGLRRVPLRLARACFFGQPM